ncbi:MAG: chemotaxis protein CheW [Pyrinomonadaceae bacterium]
MSKVSQDAISSLKQIRNDLNSLQPDDTQTLIQIGAGLEQIAVGLPEEYSAANELIIDCLGTLQAIFEGRTNDFVESAKLIGVALVAVDQGISSVPNPITDAIIEHAKKNLQKALSVEPATGEDQPTTGETPSDEDAQPESADDEASSGDLTTLDKVAAFLIQIEPEDTDDFSLICESLKALSSQSSVSSVKKLLTKAAREANKAAKGKSSDAQESLTLIGDLIEQASEPALETQPETEPALETKEEKPESRKPAAPKKDQPAEVPEKPAPEKQPEKSSKPVAKEYEPDVLTDDADKMLLTDFVVESRENIEAAESALLALETEPDNLENINTVFRAFHTVKGSAAFLGLARLTELAHLAESLLSRIRDGEIRCTGGYADLSLRSMDMLKEMFESLQNAIDGGLMTLPNSYGDLLEILTDPEAAGVSGDSDGNSKLDELEEESAEQSRGKLDKSSRLGDILVDMGKVTEEQVMLALSQKDGELLGVMLVNEGLVSPDDIEKALAIQKRLRTEKKSSGESSVRVRTDRLDRLIDMVGELVVAQSMLSQDESLLRGTQFELARKVAHTGKIVRDLQDLSMAMRMIPLKNTFSKMARVVRDVAQKCGKIVYFETDGEDTEIDRNMVDLIADPLVHMVRNAVDHGIELPEDRIQSGKDKIGRVRLSAYHAGGNVVVELQDDGKGLDSKKLLKKALEKGLIDSDKGLSESQIYNLIFAPGMSTAEKLTDVSGRGVGMDVVRRNIESMHGRIEISSEKGKGSLFTIRLPLTLAITDGMLVQVGSERYIVPTVHIYLSFRPGNNAISTVAGRGEMVQLRGELMPIIRLHNLFNIPNAIENPTEGSLVIVADEKRRCALLVDELLGQHQVVAKPLGSGVGKIPGVSGGAILGDGRVGLILDTAELVSLARQNPNERGQTESQKVA